MGNQPIETSRRQLLTKIVSPFRPTTETTATPLQQAADQALSDMAPKRITRRRAVGIATIGVATPFLAGCHEGLDVPHDVDVREDDRIVIETPTETSFAAPVAPTAEPTIEVKVTDSTENENLSFNSIDSLAEGSDRLGLPESSLIFHDRSNEIEVRRHNDDIEFDVEEGDCIDVPDGAFISGASDPRGSVPSDNQYRFEMTSAGSVSLPAHERAAVRSNGPGSCWPLS